MADTDAAVRWVLRAAVATDAAVIAQHRFGDRDVAPEAVATYLAWVEPRIDRGQYLGQVAVLDGQIIASAGAVLLDWGPRLDSGSMSLLARVTNVFTVPHCRRQGLARALVQRVLDDCRARGIVYATLAASNAGATIYRALGFAAKPDEMTLRLDGAGGKDAGAAP